MTAERERFVVLAVFGATVLLFAGEVVLAFLISSENAGAGGLLSSRAAAIDVLASVAALGAIAYALPDTRWSAIALRWVGFLSVVGIIAEMIVWMGESDATVRSPESKSFGHLAHLLVFVAGLLAALRLRQFGPLDLAGRGAGERLEED